LRGGLAAQDRVAVREAAEALDHVAVSDGVVEEGLELRARVRRRLGGERPEALDRDRLRGRILGVLEGEVEEGALVERQLLVLAARERAARQLERVGVGGERVGGAAMKVARELVEQQHEGEASPRRLGPAVEPAGARLLVEIAEAAPQLL